LVPITDVFVAPMLLVVRSSLPVKNVTEFIEYAKANPGKVNFGSPGSGSLPHLLVEEINKLAKVQIRHVAYRGFTPMLQALQGDELDAVFIPGGLSQQTLQSGKGRAIAVEKQVKAPDLPAVPDLTEAIPGFETPLSWAYVLAPAGTSQPIMNRLNEAFGRVLKSPDVTKRIEAGGQLVLGKNQPETIQELDRNIEISTRLVKELKDVGVRFD
jgi:tripartite-type tricarboxylate transporter receptor subunit TctC